MSRVVGILVTYGRPYELARALNAIAGQTIQLSGLIVVDNGGPDSRTAAAVEASRRIGLEIELISPETNLGPAGGRALGMDVALTKLEGADWLALFDDDDTLPTSGTLAALIRFAEDRRLSGETVGGVGLRGARFDARKVRTVAIEDAELANGAVRVDHLHGGFFPVYSVAAVREVGTFRGDFFFGFEELEYGLRMTAAGYSLVVDGALWQECAAHFAAYEQRVDPRLRLDELRWSRYYSFRNLLSIVIDQGHRVRAARVGFVRGIAKPTANLPFHPALARAHLRLGTKAIRDAWSGRLGAIPGADPADVAWGRKP